MTLRIVELLASLATLLLLVVAFVAGVAIVYAATLPRP